MNLHLSLYLQSNICFYPLLSTENYYGLICFYSRFWIWFHDDFAISGFQDGGTCCLAIFIGAFLCDRNLRLIFKFIYALTYNLISEINQERSSLSREFNINNMKWQQNTPKHLLLIAQFIIPRYQMVARLHLS